MEKYVEKRNRKKLISCSSETKKPFFGLWKQWKSAKVKCPRGGGILEQNNWGGILEQNKPTPNMPLMKEVKAELGERTILVSDFSLTDENMKKEIANRKNWTAPGIDGIPNFWWKKFEPAQKAFRKPFTDMYVDTAMYPGWWSSGRTVLLPKMKNLSDEKNYRPITCLNISYKILKSLVAKYMREHTAVNKIWDEGQLGAVEGILGTVDQLIMDRCIKEEIKQYHRNLAAAFYDYKNAYDKVHHDWMIRVYEWIGIPRSVIKLIKELMRKCKTKLEIWRIFEKMTRQWIQILCGFL